MKNLFKTVLFAACVGGLTCQLAAQPAGAKPIPTPNGEVWLVDESWFEKDPPFLEFYHYGQGDGLKLQGVLDDRMLRDSRGDLWMSDGPAFGLIRFDGHEFRNFTKGETDSLHFPRSHVLQLFEAPGGWLWIRHEGGFSRFDLTTERFRHYPMRLDSSEAAPLDFFAGRQDTSGFFDPRTNRFVRAFQSRVVDVTDTSRSQNVTFYWVFEYGWQDADGNIWSFRHTPIGNGLVCVNPKTGITELHPVTGIVVRDKATSPPYDPWCTFLLPDAKGENLWLGGWRGGLLRFHVATKRWTQYASNYVKEYSRIKADLEIITSAAWAPDGKLWLGTAFGIMQFDPATQRFSAWSGNHDPGSFHANQSFIRTMLLDPQGRLWVGAGNLHVHDDKRHFFQRPNIAMPGGRIVSVNYDAETDRSFFLKDDEEGNGSGGIYVIDEKTGRMTGYPSRQFYRAWGKSFLNLNGMTRRGDECWLVSEMQLFKLDWATGKYIEVPVPPPPELRGKVAFFQSFMDIQTSKDGSLWISILNQATDVVLVHFFPDENRFEYIRRSADGIRLKEPGKLFVDRRGRLWVMSNNTDRQGVNCYDPSTGKVSTFVHEPKNPNSLPHNMVTNMVEDEQGRIWMATFSGLCHYDPADGKIYRATGLQGLYEHLTLDRNGNVWLSGDEAVMYNPATGKARFFDYQNGMYWTGEALYTRKDGAVCWAHHYRIFPGKIPVLTEGSVCRLTAFKTFDRDVPTTVGIDFLEKITLRPFDNTFSIAWSARSFTNPEQDSFYFQLEDFDGDWRVAGAAQRSASWQKLPPGSYTFRLKCKNRDGVFGPEKRLHVRILPAYYQTWWFKLLVLSALAGVVAVIASLRQRQKRLAAELKQREAEFKQKEAELNQRVAEYQVAALRSQMNPHFIFNSLNSINRFVQMSGPDAASNYLTKFARLIRLVLDNSRSDTITLDSELEAVKIYLELESLRFVGQFEWHLKTEDSLDTEAIAIPPLIIQPYLENAIWHGLMQKEGGERKLDISLLSEKEGWLNIYITDNGVGRQAASAIKSKSATRQKSHGMDITAERLKMFTQRTGKQIEIAVTDLFDGQGQASGTVVKILLET